MSALDVVRCSAPDDNVGVAVVRAGSGLDEEDVVPMVESVLRAAMDRLDAEAAAARADASAAVHAAVQRSADLVLSLQSSHRATARASEPVGAVAVGQTSVPEPADGAPGRAVVGRDEAQVYDLFWSEIPADQPIRERLRRWAQRPPI
ncbi:MAG: hypothetical protein ACRDZU_01625 [Acidimicrobiales bacterium]